MQLNTLKLKNKKKKRKLIGRGGKKGTYSGKGNKGQKARSGGNVNPLFEGGRSTLVDHMKKKRGFTAVKAKKSIVNLSDLEKNFKEGDIINVEALIKANLVKRVNADNGVKILGTGKLTKKLTLDKSILLTKSAEKAFA
jgi:large subunit ribosomal protein L15